MKVKHFEHFEEILIISDTLILHMGKLSLMRGSNVPKGAELGSKQDSLDPMFSITKFLNREKWVQSPSINVGKKQYTKAM